METREPDFRRAAAVHEAGHAVVARAVGLNVHELRIGHDGKGGACTDDSAHLPILDQIAVAAAGLEAVELLSAPTWELAGVADAAKIEELLEDYSQQSERLRQAGHERAKEILTSQLSALNALADALALSGILDAKALAPWLGDSV